MREIKFKGKRLDNGKLVFGDYISPNIIREYHDENDTSQFSDWNVDPNTVGQYTGLQDKNGTDIYEGDILNNDFKVSFSAGQWSVEAIDKNTCSGYWITRKESLYLEHKRYEVTGNIHDTEK